MHSFSVVRHTQLSTALMHPAGAAVQQLHTLQCIAFTNVWLLTALQVACSCPTVADLVTCYNKVLTQVGPRGPLEEEEEFVTKRPREAQPTPL